MAKENLPHHCKTFLAAISHFPQTPPSVLPAYCNRNRPPSCPEFRRGTPLIRVPHTFGLFPVPGAVLPFFYVYVAKSAESVSWGKATFCPFLLLYFFSGAEV